MIFDELSPNSKKATAKTLLALSELCNSIILNDLSDGDSIFQSINPEEFSNGEALINKVKVAQEEQVAKANAEEEEALRAEAKRIFNQPSYQKNEKEPIRVNYPISDEIESSQNESIQKDTGLLLSYVPIDEFAVRRDTEPVDDVSIPLSEKDKVVEINYNDAKNTSEDESLLGDEAFSSRIVHFDPLRLKDMKDSMFMGLDINGDEFSWEMDNDEHLLVLGDTFGKESNVGKLLADYAFNNKNDVQLRIINPNLGDTGYLAYRTGEKSVASTASASFKFIKETYDLMISRYTEYDNRNSLTLESIRSEQPRVILWVEELNYYIPTPKDNNDMVNKKNEALHHLVSILRTGRNAKIHLALKSSTNLSYELLSKMYSSGDMLNQFELPHLLTVCSNDALRNNQLELPRDNISALEWHDRLEDSDQTVLVSKQDYCEFIYLMQSHRTSAP